MFRGNNEELAVVRRVGHCGDRGVAVTAHDRSLDKRAQVNSARVLQFVDLRVDVRLTVICNEGNLLYFVVVCCKRRDKRTHSHKCRQSSFCHKVHVLLLLRLYVLLFDQKRPQSSPEKQKAHNHCCKSFLHTQFCAFSVFSDDSRHHFH